MLQYDHVESDTDPGWTKTSTAGWRLSRPDERSLARSSYVRRSTTSCSPVPTAPGGRGGLRSAPPMSGRQPPRLREELEELGRWQSRGRHHDPGVAVAAITLSRKALPPRSSASSPKAHYATTPRRLSGVAHVRCAPGGIARAIRVAGPSRAPIAATPVTAEDPRRVWICARQGLVLRCGVGRRCSRSGGKSSSRRDRALGVLGELAVADPPSGILDRVRALGVAAKVAVGSPVTWTLAARGEARRAARPTSAGRRRGLAARTAARREQRAPDREPGGERPERGQLRGRCTCRREARREDVERLAATDIAARLPPGQVQVGEQIRTNPRCPGGRA